MAVDSMSSDELLQLKKRARRRLVGAVALMLIALVVLRFVVESRPPAAEKPAEVAIDGLKPPAAGSERTRAFAAPDTDPGASLASAGEVPPAAELPVATQKADSASPSGDAGTARNDAAQKPKPEPEPEPKPKPEPEPKPEPKPKPDRPKAEPRPEPAAVEPVKPKPDAKPGRHVASVVALSDASKAAELQRKLQAQGVKAYTETVDVNGKTLTRVKIGPYDSAEALEKARAKLALMGL